MKKLIQENSFVKDMKKLKKRNFKLEKVFDIVDLLLHDAQLPHNCRPHKLKGEYNGFSECHIEGDWVMIYTFDEDCLFLQRTGTHTDLFKKYS